MNKTIKIRIARAILATVATVGTLAACGSTSTVVAAPTSTHSATIDALWPQILLNIPAADKTSACLGFATSPLAAEQAFLVGANTPGTVITFDLGDAAYVLHKLCDTSL